MAASEESVDVSTDFSSDSSSVSDGWLELTKSDYAKVIFSDRKYNRASGTLECKFQITDNVHEDPNDYVGLFHVGFKDLSQCLASKMLSQTKCEDDGKFQHCVFIENELPCFKEGYYQFLYVTRDQEVCGASTPLKIMSRKSSVEFDTSEKMDGDFLLVNQERKIKEEINENEEISGQRTVLSELKKEGIINWIPESPDIDSLNKHIESQFFTISALQESKDIAVRELSNLHTIVTSKDAELNQLKNMLAAYEEKMNMSLSFYKEKDAEVIEVREFSEAQEEKLKTYELVHKEQQTEINDLKKKLEEMENKQKTNECYEIPTEAGKPSIESVLEKTKDLVSMISDTTKNLDFKDEAKKKKFFELGAQLQILLSRMQRASDTANICDRDGLLKEIHSMIEKDVKGNSCVGSSPCALKITGPTITNSKANVSEVEKSDFSTVSSADTSFSSDSSEGEIANEDMKRIPSKESLELKISEDRSFKLPHFGIIIKDDEALTSKLQLNVEDISLINRLTEKMKQGFNVYEAIEFADECYMKGEKVSTPLDKFADDSSSDSGSDVEEILDCTTKKDLLCVDRVIKALASLCNQTSLEQLIVVVNEDDENLKCWNQWNVLLKKCAFHYQFAILLEYIEKKKEAINEASDMIFELYAKCKLVKDEAKAVYEKQLCSIDERDKDISRLKGELKLKKDLLDRFCFEREGLKIRVKEAEQTIQDFRARLLEASNLYKKQYIKIRKLSKKLLKYNSKDMTKDCKERKVKKTKDCKERNKNTSSFEIVQIMPFQKVNDSDTGEHMFEKASKAMNEEVTTGDNSGSRYLNSFKNERNYFTSILSQMHDSYNHKNNKEQSSAKDSANSRLSLNSSVFVDQRLQYEKTLLTTIIQQLEKKNCIASKFLRTVKEDCYKIHEPMGFSACLKNLANALKLPADLSVNKQKGHFLINKNKTLEQELRMLKQNVEVYQIKIKKKEAELTKAYNSLKTMQAQIDSNNKPKTTFENYPDLDLNQNEDLVPSSHELIEDAAASTTANKQNVEFAESESFQKATVFSNFASYRLFQEKIKEQFSDVKTPTALMNPQVSFISCYVCKDIFPMAITPSDLMYHLETKHSMKICPICGQLFEEEVPTRYFEIHVEQHLETE